MCLPAWDILYSLWWEMQWKMIDIWFLFYHSTDEPREIAIFVCRLQLLQKLGVLLAQFYEVLLVVALPLSLSFPIELLSDFMCIVTLFNKFVQFLVILLSVFVVFVWVVCFETDRQKFQCTLFGTDSWVLGSFVSESSQTFHHYVAKVVF